MEIPKEIALVLLPIHDRWTNKFVWNENLSRYEITEGSPVLDVYIKKSDGIWVLDDPWGYKMVIRKNGDDQRSPVGEWTYGAQVYPIESDRKIGIEKRLEN